MGAIQNIIRKMRDKNSMLARATTEDRVHHTVQERKKSSNERELEDRYEKIRQENIKKQLEKMRAAERREMFVNKINKEKPLFKGKSTMLDNNKKLYSSRTNNLFLKTK